MATVSMTSIELQYRFVFPAKPINSIVAAWMKRGIGKCFMFNLLEDNIVSHSLKIICPIPKYSKNTVGNLSLHVYTHTHTYTYTYAYACS